MNMYNINIKKIAVVTCCICGLFLSACDVMDTKPYEMYSEDMVWSTKQTADAYVFQTYAEIIPLFVGRAGIEAWTPNGTSYNGWSSDAVARDLIDRYYNAGFNQFGKLRRCNLIIEKSQESTGLTENQKKELVAEGKMLRALVYYYQALRMGRFVPINKVLSPGDTDDFDTPLTSSVAESYQYIIKDVNDAIKGLPESSTAGRMNMWTALAYKTEICLAAAAYTGNQSYFDQCISAADSVINLGSFALDPQYGNMFLEAGKTSSEIIFAMYRLSENTTASSYAELINMVPFISNDDLIKSSCSPLFKNTDGQTFYGWHFYSPTQNLVDDYLVIDSQDGKAKQWWETSQFNASVVDDMANIQQEGIYTAVPVNVPSADDMGSTSKGQKIVKAGKIIDDANISRLMFEGRDQRFYETVAYDSCYWLNAELVTTCCNGNAWGACRTGNGGQADSWHTTTTNYYWRKAVYNVKPTLMNSQKTDYHVVLLRLGKIYLNKAEALLMKGQVSEALNLLNLTRVNHGKLPEVQESTTSQAWADYKRERRVEMALENDYYWSLLRWGKYGGDANNGKASGEVIDDLNIPAYKIQITKDRKRFFIGQAISNFCYDRNFTVKRYLFPIPQAELDKRAASGIHDDQNPGW